MTDRSRLCRACGFCCDGTLFDHAPLEPDEVPSARRRGLRVVSISETDHALAQPCARHGETGCAVYGHRPAACRRFDCLLVKALDQGEVSLEESLDLVAQVRASTQPSSLLRLYFHRPRGV